MLVGGITSAKGVFSPIEIISATNLLKTEGINLKVVLSRVYYSKLGKAFYLILIVWIILLLVLMMLGFDQQNYNLSVFLLTFMLVCVIFEAIYRVIMEGNIAFFSENWNIFDISSLSLSCIICCVSFGLEGFFGSCGKILAIVINLVRLFLIFFKLLRMLKRMKNTGIAVSELNDFSDAEDIQTPHSQDMSQKAINAQAKSDYDVEYKRQGSSKTDVSEA
ncbi:unnamed protein product [Blepharisma stoltei]|uniref:Ion transport domain-containing protein n=1 Tax=Blepharisma stoltei TaxID=1481888 RepID=A0AAU9ISN7_9CILI|nr:unnamed protein product [Blepharisma stoltei]